MAKKSHLFCDLCTRKVEVDVEFWKEQEPTDKWLFLPLNRHICPDCDKTLRKHYAEKEKRQEVAS